MTLALACSLGGMFWWTQSTKLQNERDDTKRDLHASLTTIPGSDILKSIVTVKNDGKADIGWHKIWCYARRLETESKFRVESINLGYSRPDDLGIKAGGDGQSENCMSFYQSPDRVTCADVTVRVEFSLADQPDRKDTKELHFITREGFGKWYEEPITDSELYCP